MNVLRSALFGCLIIGLVLNSSATVRTESPKPSPTREQQEKLKERDLYLAEANRLQREGKLVEAIAAAGKKLAIERQVFGDVHEDVAGSLESLAEMHHQRENFAAARKARQEVLTIRVKLHGEEHWKVTDARLALADVERLGRMTPRQRQRLAEANRLNGEVVALYQQGRFREAVDQARQVLEIRKQALGEQHPDYATSLNNLAALYKSQGDYAKAEPLYRQALEIYKRALGEKHPDYATSLNNLAMLYDSQGDYAKAEPLYRQALDIRKQTLGEEHPAYATSLNNLAGLYDSQGDYAKAEPLCQKALAISHANLELAAAAQSQRQQLAMLQQLRFRLDGYLSLAPRAKQTAEHQYRPVLLWKGMVGRRQRQQRLARQHPELAKDFDDLDHVAARLASLALSMPDPKRLEAHRRQIQELTEEKERLEGQLARRSSAFRKEKERQHLEPAQLQTALPADAVLLDFLEYTHFTPSAEKKGEWLREHRLVAFVVRRDSLVRVDIGSVKLIKEAVDKWRLALQRRFRTEGDTALGADVRKLVWHQLEEHLRGAKVVLISPDGALARVPFAALPGSKKDSYLLEEMALAVVPVPRFLPELLAARPDEDKTEPSLLLVGDVSYDATSGAAVADSRSAPRAGTLWSWTALENTRAEVAAVKDSFQRRFRRAIVTDLREDEASEAEVRKQAPKHRYLHLATHGFFAPPELRSALSAASRGKDGEVGYLFGGRKDVAGFHPGLLSGLVLAGANRPAEAGNDDGILTALEVESLDLSGVELAVLASCKTGLGEAAGGEGLLGLQRAFQVAGARSVMAGLWEAEDKATRDLMIRFYENLWKKKLPKLEALRQAQLWMLKEGLSRGMIDPKVPREKPVKDDGRLPPYYWAAFALSGDWR